jgi:glycosyltransferase involved in cell wall biosynthesis
MRVIYVVNGLGAGGAERSLAEMLPRLPDAGVDASVVCLYRRPEGVERSVLAAGTPVTFLAGSRLPGRVRELRRVLCDQRPDLLHTTLLESSMAGRLAATRTGVPVLTSLVNTPYAPARLLDPNIRSASLAAVRLGDGWTARHLTAHFHAITHAVKDAAVRDLGIAGDRITVIERGRDPERLGLPSPQRRQRARDALELGADAEVVVNVGRLEYQKGQRHLIEAAARLLAERPRAVVLIAGRQGQASAEVEAMARPFEGRIRLLGHRDDLPEVLAAADVFAFPSLFEGLGGSLIEAMALGLPIVASDLPAIREVVEDGANATLVPAAAPGPLAEALGALLDDRGRAEAYGRRSRQRFEERFTLERSTERMLALYDTLVPGAREAGVPR